MILGKQAACLRTVGSRNPDPKIAALEDELKEVGNSIGMGAMGFMGSLHGGRLPHRGRLLPHRRHAHERAHVLPVLAPRHRALFPDGRAEFRTDPEWFTDYMRRPTVEWETGARQAANIAAESRLEAMAQDLTKASKLLAGCCATSRGDRAGARWPGKPHHGLNDSGKQMSLPAVRALAQRKKRFALTRRHPSP